MVFLTTASRTWWRTPVYKKWYFNLSGFNRYGLYQDDLDYELTGDKEEVMRRVPPKLYNEYVYRNIRANQLDMTKSYLPKEQWPTYEEDLANRWATPYLEEIWAERREKAEWDKFYSK